MVDQLEQYRKILNSLGKRPRTVLEKILENGSVSTYELGELGYDQPPRAAQDLKEAGVPLKTTFGKHPETGSRMGIYSIDFDAEMNFGNGKGRRAFPKKFKQLLLKIYDKKCNVCNVQYPATALQIDHRVPYIVGGETDELDPGSFQLLCASHQRSKSWECEHCPNYKIKNLASCESCYWAYPDTDFAHVATIPEKRADIIWQGESEIADYLRLRKFAHLLEFTIPDAIKVLIKKALDKQ